MAGVQCTFSYDRYIVVIELQHLDALQWHDEIRRQTSQEVVRQVERFEFGEMGERSTGHGHDAVVSQVQMGQRGHRPKTVILEHVDLVVIERQGNDALKSGKRSAPNAVELIVRQGYDLQVRQPGQRVGAKLAGQQVGAEVQLYQRPQPLQVGSRSRRQ